MQGSKEVDIKMRGLFLVIGTLAIWGLLAWGNIAIINWSNDTYQERMATNYLVNKYEGRLLLNQTEYTEFKKSLLSDEIKINNLDIYGSADVLIIYDISSPESNTIPFVGEPQSQGWYYERGRGMDYGAYAFVITISLAVGAFLNLSLSNLLGDL